MPADRERLAEEHPKDDLVNRVVRAATLLSGIQMQKKLGKRVQTEVNLNPADVNAEVRVVMYDYA